MTNPTLDPTRDAPAAGGTAVSGDGRSRGDAWRFDDLPVQYRSVKIRQDAVDKDKRTVELSFSSEAEIRRFFGVEVLDHEPEAVDLARFNDGAQMLENHERNRVIGVVERGWLADRKGHAIVRFSTGPLGAELFDDVVAGIRRNVSIAYRINKIERIEEEDKPDKIIVRQWEPLELSIVSIPADASVGVGRADGSGELPADALPHNHLANARYPVRLIGKEPDMSTKETKTETVADPGPGATRAAPATVPATPASLPAPSDPAVAARLETQQGDVKDERQRISEIMAIEKEWSAKLGTDTRTAEAINDGWTVDKYRQYVLGSLLDRNQHVELGKPTGFLDMEPGEAQRFNLCKAIRAQGRNDWKGAEFEAECSRAVADRVDKDPGGFFLPYDVLMAPVPLSRDELERMTGARVLTSAGVAAGAELVATNLLASSFIDVLRPRLMTFQMGARMLDGLVGNVDIPKQTLAGTAAWIAEEGASGESELDTGSLQLRPETLANHMKVSRRLTLQGTPSAEALVRADLISGIAEGLDKAAIQGSGAGNEPTGILNTAGIGDVALGANGAAPTWASVVELETDVAVSNADVGSLGYLTTPQARGKYKTTLKAAAVSGYIMGDERNVDGFGNMNGYRAGATTQVPSNLTKGTGTNLSASIFGNWLDLILAMWGGLDIIVNPFTNDTQGTIRLTVFQDADIGVRRAASFSANQDINTT